MNKANKQKRVIETAFADLERRCLETFGSWPEDFNRQGTGTGRFKSASKKTKRLKKLFRCGLLLLLLLVALFVFGLVGKQDLDTERAELEQYCRMVELRRATQNELIGWPDYKNIYETECR